MGAAESIFFEDEEQEEEERGPPIEQPRRTVYPVLHESAAPVSRHYLPGNGAPRALQRQPKRRSRAGTLSDPIKLMNGLILGLPSSGKRTLLKRLEGKDPFAEGKNIDWVPVDSSYQAIVPYQPPSGCPMWDRLQINARVSQEVLFNNSRIDFAVILINPMHDQKQVQANLSSLISDLLKHYEDSMRNGMPAGSAHGEQSGSLKGTKLAKRALCLCLLCNFRDLQNSKRRGLQQADIKQYVLAIIQQHTGMLPTEDQMLLQFGTTSLYNCYGLGHLHNFMYQTYLRLKQNELEQQLAEIREEALRPHDVPHIKYKDFLKMLEDSSALGAKSESLPKGAQRAKSESLPKGAQRAKSESLPKGAQHEQEPAVPEQRPTTDNGNIPTRRLDGQETKQKDANDCRYDQKRQIMVGNAHSAPIHESVKSAQLFQKSARDALEAFLASDDDEDSVRLKHELKSTSNANSAFETDDEDDDDFFYDETGHRRRLNEPIHSSSSKPTAKQQSITSGEVSKQSISLKNDRSRHSSPSSAARSSDKDESIADRPDSASTKDSANEKALQEEVVASMNLSEELGENEDETRNDSVQTEKNNQSIAGGPSAGEDPHNEDDENSRDASDDATQANTRPELEELAKDETQVSPSEPLQEGSLDEERNSTLEPTSSRSIDEKDQSEDPTDKEGNGMGSEDDDRYKSEIPDGRKRKPLDGNEEDVFSEGGGSDTSIPEAKKGEMSKSESSNEFPTTTGKGAFQSKKNIEDDDEDDEFFIGEPGEAAESMELRNVKRNNDGNNNDDAEIFIDETNAGLQAKESHDSNESERCGVRFVASNVSRARTASLAASEENTENQSCTARAIVEERYAEKQTPPHDKVPYSRRVSPFPEPETEARTGTSPGYSAAALAAIAAAQREAELMVQQTADTTQTLTTGIDDDKITRKAKKKGRKKESKLDKKAKKDKKEKKKEKLEA